jgi:hypothetical protein
MEETKVCKQCGMTAPLKYFRNSLGRKFSHTHVTEKIYEQTRSVCRACEQENRDKYKIPNRIKVKTRNAILTHSRKLNISPDILINDYGWKYLEHKISHAYENTCNYCHNPFSEMGHGLSDATVDIMDREKLPYIENVAICCPTCNKEKGTMSYIEYAEYRAWWNKRGIFLTNKAKQLNFLDIIAYNIN